VHFQRASGSSITDSRLHDTNTRHFEPGNESGGMKAVESTGVRVVRVEADHNYGPGVWFDGRADNATVTDSRIHDNNRPGIHFEISSGAVITNNRIWSNGWGFPAWAWGGGIVLSSAGNVEVANNILAWNADGIAIISQGRSDRVPATNIKVHDNEVIGADASTDGARFAVGWVEDWSGPLFGSGSNNIGTNNRYWYATAESTITRYAWAGGYSKRVSFEATPGDGPSSYLSSTEKTSILSNAGMPATP